MNRIGEALCATLTDGASRPLPVDLATLTDAEWHEVAALAIRQRVAPLLCSRPGLPIPAGVQTILKGRAIASARRALRLQAAFRQMSTEAATRGISLVALKGIHLGTTMYASAGLREMNDVDILVRPEHAEGMSRALQSLGYRSDDDIPVPVALQVMHHLPRLSKSGIGVEVHWRLAPPESPPHVGPEELWSHVVPFTLGASAGALTPEALLVHVCVHAASHHFEQGVRPLCDVQAIVTRSADTLRWPMVIDIARSWRCERSVALVLDLTRTWIGGDIPETAITALAPEATPDGVRRMAMTHALTGAGEIHDLTPSAGAFVATGDVRHKLHLLGNRVFVPDHTIAATVRRASSLVARHFWKVTTLILRKQSVARTALDRRQTLAAWLSERPQREEGKRADESRQ